MTLSPLRITAIYAVVAATWIVVSDSVLVDLEASSPLFLLSVTKGLVFVGVTGGILYALLRSRERELELRHSAMLRSAKRVKATHERFEHLFARSAVPMFRCRVDGTIVDANQALLALFGVEDPDDIAAASLLERVADHERTADIASRISTEGRIRGAEAPFRRVDGSEFWGRLTATLVHEDREPVIEGTLEDVTTERRAEDDARFRAALYEQLPSAVVVADTDRRITGWNARAEEMLGLGPDTIGRRSSEVLFSADGDGGFFEQATTDGRWEGETDVTGPSGATVRASVSTTVVRDDERHPIGFSMVVTDLSETRRARGRLRFQARLLEQVHNAVIATDTEGTVLYWNRSAERLYGWTADEAIGQPISELTVPSPARAGAEEILAEIARTGSWQGEFEVTRKDGTTFPALVSNVTFRDRDGEPGGVVGVSTDLTRLRQAETTAREAMRLSRAVLDSVAFPVAVIARDGVIVDVNRAWTEFALENGGDLASTGIGADYLASTRAGIESDPDLADVVAGITSVLEGESELFSHRYPCHTPNEPRWFEMQATPIERLGAVIAHLDRTPEVLAQRVLENTVQEKDEFLATVSHELRTPLTAVLGFAEHLRSNDIDPAELAVFHDTIAEQAREVADLVEDLLLAGRLDTDTIAIRPEVTDASELVAAVIRPWSDTVEIDVSTHADAATVYGDPLRTRQILRNLVTNAIRHGSPPVEIEIQPQSSLTVIEVIDHGDGVPDSVMDEIFEPYTEASTRHGKPGSIGLGLYVSHRLATLMDGTLTHRRQGDTTVFTLALPSNRP